LLIIEHTKCDTALWIKSAECIARGHEVNNSGPCQQGHGCPLKAVTRVHFSKSCRSNS